MAYAAVTSLEQTIERLSNSSHISIVQNSSPQLMQLLQSEVRSLHVALEEFNGKRSVINMKKVKILEGEITEAIWEFEDVIESHFSSQSVSQSESHPLSVSLDVHELKQDADCFIEKANQMKKAYIHELYNPSPEEEEEEEEEDDDDRVGNECSKMVGLSDQFIDIRDRLEENFSQSEMRTISLYGMAGVGKTTLAKELFLDPLISSLCSKRAFVTVGPKYKSVDVLLDILKKLNSDVDETLLMGKGEELLACLKKMVYKSLKGSRYLIVLDDVWDTELWDELISSFPIGENGGNVLLTTRLEEVANNLWSSFRIRFLDKKESWDLFRQKVFGEEESFSYELERAGKKIAEKCEGLPLTIVTVADILSKAEKTAKYWSEVAAKKQSSVFVDAYDQMSKVLYPSYDYLDQHLKPCFLYFGAFPQNYPIPWYQLVDLWSAEGFRDSGPNRYSDLATTFASGSYCYLLELFSKNVIMDDAKGCGYHLHSSFWFLCNKEARKNKFFYDVNGHVDASPEEGKTYQRRLCIRNSTLFGTKDVYDSIASVSTVRSLLCTGPYHQYPVPMSLEHLTLLRVLEARIRFYEFPMEVVKLVQLRYFALTYDGNLPPSISKLLNLEYLIVDRNHSIVTSTGNSSYLPTEIWNMKELKSVRTLGRDLPHPCEGSLLPNLLQLIGVSPHSCTEDVLEKIPSLEVLVIQIELAPDATELLSVFNHISHLNKLKVLQCGIVNPLLKNEVVASLAHVSDLPSSLTTLTFSGLGFLWEEMSKISSLPNLKYLTLQCYAFRGPVWQVCDNEFRKLSSIYIEDTDLVHWKFATMNSCLPAIMSIDILHCYMLKEIPLTFGTSLEEIQVVDCNPMVVDCAKKLKKNWDDKYSDREFSLVLNVCSSWDD